MARRLSGRTNQFVGHASQGSEIDEILTTGRRGQRRNVQASLKIGFFFDWKSIFSPLLPISDFRRREYLNVVKFYPLQVLRRLDEIFWQSHHPRSCDDSTKILSRRSHELISELAQYAPTCFSPFDTPTIQ